MIFKCALRLIFGISIFFAFAPSVFGQTFSFTNSPTASGDNFALWNSWDRHGESTDIKFPSMEGDNTSTNFYFANQTYATNNTTPTYLVSEGLISGTSGYGFSPQFDLYVNSDEKIDYISWQVYHMAISANYDPPYYTNVFNNGSGIATNIASINYDSVRLTSGNGSQIIPERIEIFYDTFEEVDYHGGSDSFPNHGTIFVWDLTGYNYYNVAIEMAMGHSSNYQMRMDYTSSILPPTLNFSISNNLPIVSFDTEIGDSYTLYNSSEILAIGSDGWNLVTNFVADQSISQIIGDLAHDKQFWYVVRND